MSVRTFLFSPPQSWSQYAFVIVRFAIAAFWIYFDVPFWRGLMSGQPVTNGLVQLLFGPSMVAPLTIFFKLLETLGAITLILGFMTRLAGLWAAIEFAITGTLGLVLGVTAILKDYGLMAAAIVLVLNGSPKLSIDGLLSESVNRK